MNQWSGEQSRQQVQNRETGDQHRGRKGRCRARGSHAEAVETAQSQQAGVIHAEAAGVTQKEREVVQRFSTLTQRASG